MTDDLREAFDEDVGVEQGSYGRRLLQRVAIVLKLATMHALGNEALVTPVQALVDVVREGLLTHDALALQLVGENVFLNQEVVKLDLGAFESAQTLRAIFERLRVQEVSFRAEIDASDLRAFLEVFQRHWMSQSPEAILQEKLERIGVRAIEKAQRDALGGVIDERQNVLRTYALVAVALREALERTGEGKAVQPVRIRRAVQALAEAMEGHASLVLGLARVPDLSGDPSYHHAAVVTYVLLMGRRLGLPRKRLMDLAMAAALHEFGQTESDTRSGRGALGTMLRILEGKLGMDLFERATVAVEHRRRLDLEASVRPGVLARFVAVACTFDRLATPGPDRAALPPDQVLRILLDNAPGRFDPRVVTLFASTVGLYPVGTLVRLSNGDQAVVVEVPEEPAKMARPIVKVVRSAAGPAGHLVDLAETGGSLSIVETLDPVEESINAASFLLA